VTTAVVASDQVDYMLGLGDDALVLSHRLSEWITHGPQLEEDVALANISLDLLGQARALLSRAGEFEAEGPDEDALAFGRDPDEFRNVQLVEQENGDFAQTIARQLLFSAYQRALYDRLTASADETLAGVAAKAVKEVAYHFDHAVQWTLRLGDGTAESRRRMQAGLERLWPYVEELFEPYPAATRLAESGVAVDPAAMRSGWDREIEGVLARATLDRPPAGRRRSGGRSGVHTPALGELLGEMQALHRAHPGASW
jgi:ring-1,2-phenylacetyl-CoA epoxidase subunit PaaC